MFLIEKPTFLQILNNYESTGSSEGSSRLSTSYHSTSVRYKNNWHATNRPGYGMLTGFEIRDTGFGVRYTLYEMPVVITNLSVNDGWVSIIIKYLKTFNYKVRNYQNSWLEEINILIFVTIIYFSWNTINNSFLIISWKVDIFTKYFLVVINYCQNTNCRAEYQIFIELEYM